MGSDIRFAFRSLRRSPLVTVVAVICLALGIGANTTVYTAADAFLFHPLPGLGNPDRLVVLTETPPDGDHYFESISPANLEDWRRQATSSFEQIAAFDYSDMNVTGDGVEAERALAVLASPNLFATLGVPPLLGRGFLEEETVPGRNRVVVLGYGFWQRRFAGDSAAIGRTLKLNGTVYTIVGVARRTMVYPEGAQLFMPLALDSAGLAERRRRTVEAVGLLRPGVTVERARAEIAPIARRLAEQYPEANRGWGSVVDGLEHYQARFSRPYVMVLLGAVAFVLLIACANVANLLLARAAAREREMAVRTALGAGRARLLRALLAESLVLALVGAAAGALLALWGTRLVREAIPLEDVQYIPSLENIRVHGKALAFTVGLAVLTSLLFGLAPALAGSRSAPQASLRRGGRGSTSGGGGGGGGRWGLRRALVVGEVALSLVLMSCTGLLVRSFAHMMATDPGFRRDHLLTGQVLLPQVQYPDTQSVREFQRRLFERAQAIPGVRVAALTNTLPLSESDRTEYITIEGQLAPEAAGADAKERPWAGLRAVTPTYLEAMGIPLRHGRGILASDDERAPRIALVNETMVRRYWPGVAPASLIGRRFTVAGEPAPRVIVGVVGDVRHRTLRDPVEPEMYLPSEQTLTRFLRLAMRTERGVDPLSLAPALRREVAALDPTLALSEVLTMERMSWNSISPYRITSVMLGVLALIALVLAAAGVFGVLSYAVAQRTQEIGVRMALGARGGDVQRLVVRQGMMPALLGVAIGLAAALAAGRALGGMLVGVAPGDPATFAGVTLATVLSALAASWIPARRATRVDPMVALREE